MIQKSDLLILVVASVALLAGIFRWYQNTQDVAAVTIPASTQSVPVVAAPASTVATSATTRVIQQQDPTPTIVVTRTNLGQSSASQSSEEFIPSNDVLDAVTASASSAALARYTVQSGDSLSKIAARYATTVADLQALNDLDGTVIYIGQELNYPVPAP